MRLHKHMVDGLYTVITDGSGWDCPPERECWFEGEPWEIGREVPTERGAVFRSALDWPTDPDEIRTK